MIVVLPMIYINNDKNIYIVFNPSLDNTISVYYMLPNNIVKRDDAIDNVNVFIYFIRELETIGFCLLNEKAKLWHELYGMSYHLIPKVKLIYG